jgi:hypothetical protein
LGTERDRASGGTEGQELREQGGISVYIAVHRCYDCHFFLVFCVPHLWTGASGQVILFLAVDPLFPVSSRSTGQVHSQAQAWDPSLLESCSGATTAVWTLTLQAPRSEEQPCCSGVPLESLRYLCFCSIFLSPASATAHLRGCSSSLCPTVGVLCSQHPH